MTLRREHERVLRENNFEYFGSVENAIESGELDGTRLIYAITNPERTEIVYVGDTEEGKNVRARLRALLRDKRTNMVESDSGLYFHAIVTEFSVVRAFEELAGEMPALNRRKFEKFALMR